jgi:hypothetical protein
MSTTSFLNVHFGHVTESMVKGITRSRIHGLFGLHGGLHDSMVSLESINVVTVGGKDFLLDPLAQAVLGNRTNNLGAMIFLCVDPTDQLVQFQQTSSRVQALGFRNGLANGDSVLLQLTNHGRVVKDSAGNLAVSTSQTQYKMESRFFLNIVVAQGTAIFQLFSSKDQTLLIRRNTGENARSEVRTVSHVTLASAAPTSMRNSRSITHFSVYLPFLVLNFGLDVVDGVRRLNVQSNGFSGKGLDKNLLIQEKGNRKGML